MSPDETEKHRLETEARTWLNKGFFTQTKVDFLRKKLLKKRNSKNVEVLIAEMRRQYNLIKNRKKL